MTEHFRQPVAIKYTLKGKKNRGIPARKPFYITKAYTQLKSKPFINLFIYLSIFINNVFVLITSVAFDWYKTFTKSSYGEEKILSTQTFDDAVESWLTQKKKKPAKSIFEKEVAAAVDLLDF